MKNPFYKAIEAHWREHRPQMVRQLEQKGLLDQALEYAARRTVEAESSLMQQGMDAHQAFELMWQEWAFLPSEQDLPELPNGPPETWLKITSG